MSRRIAIVLLLCVAGLGRAEDDCGTMLRTMSRFRGTVRSIRSPATGTFNDVDLDVRFVASIDIGGKPVRFGIHSPARTFAADRIVGETFDLEAERMDCDGKFRRYLTLQRQMKTPIVESFSGHLDVGHRYRAKVRRGPYGALALMESLRLPMHHMGGISFSNPQVVGGAEQEVVFDVVALHIDQRSRWQWVSVYDATIVTGP